MSAQRKDLGSTILQVAEPLVPLAIEFIAGLLAHKDPVQVLAEKRLSDIFPEGTPFRLELELARQRAAHGYVPSSARPSTEPGDGE